MFVCYKSGQYFRKYAKMSGVDSEAQREKVFSTRCTIKQKVCSLIIGGMCTNIVFQALVSKLQLQTIPHPQPYTIQHRNQSKSLLVSQVVLLHFSIGKV